MVSIFPATSTKKSGGMALAYPDVCKVPAPPAPPVPVPFPNTHAKKMKRAEVKVKLASKIVLKKASKGDAAGTQISPDRSKVIVTHMNKVEGLLKGQQVTMRRTVKRAQTDQKAQLGGDVAKFGKMLGKAAGSLGKMAGAALGKGGKGQGDQQAKMAKAAKANEALYKSAAKEHKRFEQKLERELKALLTAAGDDPELFKMVKRLVQDIGRAVRAR